MHQSRRILRTGLGVALALTAVACATPQGGGNDPFERGGFDADQPVLLTVDNQDFRDATIYANWNGPKHRVGMVTGKTTETFEMRWRDYEMWLEVDFVGGGGFRTGETMSVWPGEHLDFIIMPGW